MSTHIVTDRQYARMPSKKDETFPQKKYRILVLHEDINGQPLWIWDAHENEVPAELPPTEYEESTGKWVLKRSEAKPEAKPETKPKEEEEEMKEEEVKEEEAKEEPEEMSEAKEAVA